MCGEKPKMDKIPTLRSSLSPLCLSLSCYLKRKENTGKCWYGNQIHQRHIIVLVLPLLKARFMFNVAV